MLVAACTQTAAVPAAALLHFDGNATDKVGTTWTNSSVTFPSSPAKFGSGAASFSSSASLSTSITYDLRSNVLFTVEGWIYPTSTSAPSYSNIVANTPNSGTYPTFWLMQNGASLIWEVANASQNSWAYSNTALGTLSANTWQHVAVCGDGTTVRLFLNGSQLASTAHNNWTNQRVMVLGALSGVTGFAGSLDEFRIVRNKALYTAAFAPPIQPFR